MGKRTVKFVKYAFFLANFLILISGASVVVVGVRVLVHRSFTELLLGTNLYHSSAYTLIAAGGIVVVIFFLGCCGALKEGRLPLTVFSIVLCAILVLMLAGGVLTYVFRDKVGKHMYDKMLKTIPLYINSTVITHAWDAVQSHFECCGVSVDNEESYLIWKTNPYFYNNETQVPKSCCMRRDPDSVKACKSNPKEYSFNSDCHVEIKAFVKGHALILGGLGIGTACLLVIGMILSCALCLMVE